MKSILKKFDVVVATRDIRYYSFVVTWILVIACYLIIFLDGFSTYHCLTVSEIWTSGERMISPFAIFCLIAGLLFSWALIEHWLVWAGPQENRRSGLIITSIFIFLMGVWSFGLSQHWIFLQIEQGKMTYEDYWLKMPHGKAPLGPRLTWEQFLREKRCKEGIGVKDLSDDRRCELEREYNQKYGGIRYRVTCADPPKSRLELWKEEQDNFKVFMKEYKKLLKESLAPESLESAYEN